ncbi:MAG: IS66 family insertion sequence element accessory protein TnpB [Saprospiraceae bacterium]|nr:IS66 family insertion sequence element accessory protein TnpB [Saprospiraceae bacterium]
MIGFGSHQRFYLYRSSVDMRKGLWSLGGIVRQELKADPMDGSVYVFSLRVIRLSRCWCGTETDLWCT